MTDSIFTNQVPLAPDNGNPSNITLGTLFVPAVDGQITHFRWLAPTILPAGPGIFALWRFNDNTTGTELARLDTAGKLSLTAGAWNQIQLTTPVNVVAGQKYVVGIGGVNRYAASNNLFNGVAIVSGNLTAPADVAGANNGRFLDSDTAAGWPHFPSQTYQATGYFVDVVFNATVAPSTKPGIWGVSR